MNLFKDNQIYIQFIKDLCQTWVLVRLKNSEADVACDLN